MRRIELAGEAMTVKDQWERARIEPLARKPSAVSPPDKPPWLAKPTERLAANRSEEKADGRVGDPVLAIRPGHLLVGVASKGALPGWGTLRSSREDCAGPPVPCCVLPEQPLIERRH